MDSDDEIVFVGVGHTAPIPKGRKKLGSLAKKRGLKPASSSSKKQDHTEPSTDSDSDIEFVEYVPAVHKEPSLLPTPLASPTTGARKLPLEPPATPVKLKKHAPSPPPEPVPQKLDDIAFDDAKIIKSLPSPATSTSSHPQQCSPLQSTGSQIIRIKTKSTFKPNAKGKAKARSPSPAPVLPEPLKTVRFEVDLNFDGGIVFNLRTLAREAGQLPPSPTRKAEAEPEKPQQGTKRTHEDHYDVKDDFIDDSELAIDERQTFAETQTTGFYIAKGEIALKIVSASQAFELCQPPAKRPKLEQLDPVFDELEENIGRADVTDDPKSTPPEMEKAILRLALKAIHLGEYNEEFFTKLVDILPWDTSTVETFVKTLVYPEHQTILGEKEDAMLKELKKLADAGFESVKEAHNKAVAVYEARLASGEISPPVSRRGSGTSEVANAEEPKKKRSATRPAQLYPFNDRMKQLVWALVLLSEAMVELELEHMGLENSSLPSPLTVEELKVERKRRTKSKVEINHKIVAAFPEDWMTARKITGHASSMRQKANTS